MPALDRNGTIGTPQDDWIWLAPDWSDYAASTGEADKKVPHPGWTHVKTRVTSYNDGRVVTQVLDENNRPVADQNGPRPPLREATDQKQANVFSTQTNDTTVPGTQQRVQINPANGQPEMATVYPNNNEVSYRPATSAELSQAGYTGRTEGSPLPGGGFDNESPVWVVRGPGNVMVGQPRALTDDERKAWNLSRERARNPGGKTDEEVRAGQTATKRAPIEGHPGVYLITTVNPQTSQTESHYENEQGARVPQPADIKPGTIVKGGGANGEDVQAVTDPATGTIKYQPIPGAQVPAENRPIPSGAPVYRPDYNQDDLGLGSYNEQLLAAQRAGIISAEQGRQLVTQASALAQTSAGHGSTLRGQESTTRGQDITQRQQDLNETDSRRTFQGSGFDNSLREIGSNARYLGAGHGGMAADAFLEALNLRQRYAAGAGGFEEHPQVAAARAGTQVHIGPDGNVAISPPGTVPGGMADAAGIRTGAAMTGTGVDAPVNRGAMQPAFRPPPPISGAVAPTPGEPGGPPLQTTYPAYQPPTIPTPSSLPPADEFGHQPSQLPPVDYTHPDVGTNLPYNADPQQGPVGQLPSYLQPVATPQWQPHGVTANLRSQGYSDEEIQQAMQLAGVG